MTAPKRPQILVTGAAGTLAQKVIAQLRETCDLVAVDFREQPHLLACGAPHPAGAAHEAVRQLPSQRLVVAGLHDAAGLPTLQVDIKESGIAGMHDTGSGP